MAEYLAPGVYVEETSFRSKSIEGVSTTTTGFVGPTRFGPVDGEPELVTSLAEFQARYGDGTALQLGGTEIPNFVWHGVRAFFSEGGKRLYVARVYGGTALRASVTAGWTGGRSLQARHPGAAGAMRLAFTFRLSGNLLSGAAAGATTPAALRFGALQPRDLVVLTRSGIGVLAVAERDPGTGQWTFVGPAPTGGGAAPTMDGSTLDPATDAIRAVTFDLTVNDSPSGSPLTWTAVQLDPSHRTNGVRDDLGARFGATGDAPFVMDPAMPATATAHDVLSLYLQPLFAASNPPPAATVTLVSLITDATAPTATPPRFEVRLSAPTGADGATPTAAEYTGQEDSSGRRSGLLALETLEDISIVAAPGATFGYAAGTAASIDGVLAALVQHASRMRYRIAVLDSGNAQTIAQVRQMRAKFDSKHAALYYPWVTTFDPVSQRPIDLPPSGFIAGIYARNDVERAVYKAPANEVVGLAIGLEHAVSHAQQEVLNPEGINCLRFFEGRGYRVWGARTISSDPEWKYVNVRRYFAYLERSIDRGSQWAVFEPNGELLWANVRRTIEDFLQNEWQSGALLGDRAEKAFFVRCDRSTMTQNDLDNGRLVCLVGVAVLKPAEFVVIRIGQWTGDRKN